MLNLGPQQPGGNETSLLAARTRVGTLCELLPVSMPILVPSTTQPPASPLVLLDHYGQSTAHGLKV